MVLQRPVFVGIVLIATLGNLGAQALFPESPPKPPLGLPAVNWPADNPYSAARVELGWYLFFDARLSANGKVSCATCHPPEHAFAGGDPRPLGVTAKTLRRRAPTLINRAYGRSEFDDGRAATLEAQITGPVTNVDEMGTTPEAAAGAISKIAGYRPLFERAFGDPQITFDRITKAIASFERTILSGNSPYDRFLNGDKQALSQSAKRGLQIFERSGECSECHNGFNFTNEKFASLGIGPDQTTTRPRLGGDHRKAPRRWEVQGAHTSGSGAYRSLHARPAVQNAGRRYGLLSKRGPARCAPRFTHCALLSGCSGKSGSAGLSRIAQRRGLAADQSA